MKLAAVIAPDGGVTQYQYDNEDRVISMTDSCQNTVITVYDRAGRVLMKQYPDGGRVSYEYDVVGNVITETNENGATTHKTYDAAGKVLSVIDANGNISRNEYDKMSRLVRSINAVSGVTLYHYSAAGDLLSETDALGHIKSYTYDAYGNKLSSTDPNGNTTLYTYDANDNMLSVTDPLGNQTTFTYDCRNLRTSMTDAKGRTVTYGYDALGRRISVTDAKGNVIHTAYDANGNMISITDAKGNVVSAKTYTEMNLVATETDAAGNVITYQYNHMSKPEVITDILGHKRQYQYNSRGQIASVIDTAHGVTTATYDNLANMTALTGPLGGSTAYTYDTLGRLIAETTASGGTIQYGYNALNLKESLINARGQMRQYFYDATGRITGIVSEEDSVNYTYDANGNILTVKDANGTVIREYDALNRVTSCTDTFGKTIRYRYDAVDKLSTIVYPDNTEVIYMYDENGNLSTVTDWANRVTAYTYDANNKVIGITKPDGSVTTTAYDNAQRVISTAEYTSGGTLIVGYEYTYDELGRITEETHLASNTKMCYTYDKLSRVTKRTTINLSTGYETSEEFTYDIAGNVNAGVAQGDCVYDKNNRLMLYDGEAVTYDADGNMTRVRLNGETLNFAYDAANRLVSTGYNTYTYNAQDVRIRNLCCGRETLYTYDTNVKLSRLLVKTTDGEDTKYVYGLGLIGEEHADDFLIYHFDYRGSTVAITSCCGMVTDTFRYDTYGKLIARTGYTETLFMYNGRDGVVTDGNGLIYMRARYYCPQLKRFINADIIAGEMSNAITLNRYAYANGNPVSNVDPFGLVADERKNSIDMNALYKKFSDSRITGDFGPLFAMTLEQILNFKHLFSASVGENVFIAVNNTKIYYSTSMTSGKGDIEFNFEDVEHLETLDSIKFSGSINEYNDITLNSDGSVGLEYTYQLNKYSRLVASIAVSAPNTFSADYTITTTDNYNNLLSTTVGLEHNMGQNNQPPKPTLETVPSIAYEYAWRFALVGTILLVYATANNASTVGISDDTLLIPTALKMLGTAYKTITAAGAVGATAGVLVPGVM